MPSLLLAHAVYLFVPKPGRLKYEVRRALEARADAQVLWHGRLASAGEWRAIHWVDSQRNMHGGPLDPFRDYRTEQGSGARGMGSALDALWSAAQVLLPGTDTWLVEVVVARLTPQKAPPGPTSGA